MKRQWIIGVLLQLAWMGYFPLALFAQIEVGKNNNVGIRMPEQPRVTLSLDNREGSNSKNLINIECNAKHLHYKINRFRDTLYNIRLKSFSNVKYGTSYLYNISGKLYDTAGRNTSWHVRRYRLGIHNEVRVFGLNESYPSIVTSNSVMRYFGMRNWMFLYGNPNIIQSRQEVFGITNFLHTYRGKPNIAIGFNNHVRSSPPNTPVNHYGIYNSLITRVSYDTLPGTAPVALYSEIISGGGEYGGRRYAGYFVGDVKIENTLYVDNIQLISDQRLKRNIADIPNALSIIQSLHPVSFFYVDSISFRHYFPQGKQYGLIAQEVENVVPELVDNAVFVHSLREVEVVDSTGAVVDFAYERDPDVHYKSLNYVQLIPLLIKAIQEQQQQIDSLKAQVQQLRQQLKK